MIVRALFLALLLALAPLAHAQLRLPGQAAPAAKASAEPVAASDADVRAQAEAQLAEARRRQEAARLEQAPVSGADGVAGGDRQRLLDRLVLVYGERVKLLDELKTVQESWPDSAERTALLAELSGPPPYSAVRADELRDEHDALRDRLSSLASTRRALEAQKAALIERGRRASEAVRLAEDRLARADRRRDGEHDRQELELALLRRQLADGELATVDLILERVRLEAGHLQPLNRDIERLLSRVLPEQTLSREELEQHQAKFRRSLAKVTASIDRVVAQKSQRAGERERLARLAAKTGGDASLNQRLHLLDEQLETDRLSLMTLSWLQGVYQTADDVWQQRFVALASHDAATRQAVIAALSQTRAEIDSRKRLFRELQDAARIEVRQQQLRLDGSLLDPAAAAREAAILATLKQRVENYQQVDVAGSRLAIQLDRWLDDFGFRAETTTTENWKLAALQIGEHLQSIWNFEMFAVEESTLVDGKTVTVAYGVTIGKSIGALALFILGYWLFSTLSKRLQRVMVGRFGVDEQIAGVIRRWSMISLAVILIIFVLNLARIPLTVFAFLGGALAIGVGFGTQTIIKNVISGIIILFERKIRVGDIIALNGMTGHVTQVDLRASTVRAFDGVEALVPNSNFLESQVVNWTYSNPKVRREISVGVAYGSPLREASEIIIGCAADHGLVLDDPEPEVFFEEFGDNALLLALVFWVEIGQNVNARRVSSDLRYAVEKRLASAGITIAFPQRDVHLDVSQPLPVRLTRAPAS